MMAIQILETDEAQHVKLKQGFHVQELQVFDTNEEMDLLKEVNNEMMETLMVVMAEIVLEVLKQAIPEQVVLQYVL